MEVRQVLALWSRDREWMEEMTAGDRANAGLCVKG